MLDKWIEKIRKCELLPELDLKHLCEYVQVVMRLTPNPTPYLARTLPGPNPNVTARVAMLPTRALNPTWPQPYLAPTLT